MCGRYTSTTPLEVLARVFGVEEVCTERLPPRYNVAPTQLVYAVANRAGRRALGTLRWGLVPPGAKDPSAGSKMINARAESLADRPAYRAALARRRCLIPADAFYEWQRLRPGQGGSAKRPWAVRRRDGQTMALAGLWEAWRDPAAPEGEPLRTCTIITTAANQLLAAVHSRMPVVLCPAKWEAWLDPGVSAEEAAGLLESAPGEWFEAFPVRTLVNDVRRDGPELLEPSPELG